jgi:hypothetical protein
VPVYRLSLKDNGNSHHSFYIPSSAKANSLVAKYASDFGLQINGVKNRPSGITSVSPLRIALWDTYGGSMPSGWVRWLMEQYHFPFHVIYAKELDAGNLKKSYDVIVLVTGAVPSVSAAGANRRNTQPRSEEVPIEFRESLGRITGDTSIPQLKQFLQAGGTIITIGSSTNLAYHLGLPVRNALVEMNNGQERPLSGEKFYIPGSIMRVAIDSTNSSAWGMPSKADVYFDESPVFKIAPAAIARGEVKPIAWFPSDKTLRSGWAWGQEYLKDGVAAFEAAVGKGKLYAFGPEITFRGQTHAPFKLLFNQLIKQNPD